MGMLRASNWEYRAKGRVGRISNEYGEPIKDVMCTH